MFMKILKLFFVFAIVSLIAVSCKESKKEEVSDDSAVEMTEEATSEDATSDDDGEAAATGAAATGAAASGDADSSEESATHESSEAIEATSKDVEEVPVPEGVIAEELADTPVVYPGCRGTVDEIRACNKESFVAYIKSKFNHDIAKEAGLKSGDYEIGTVIHVNKAGRVFSLRVIAPNAALKSEMERVINSTPQVVPATSGGEPVGVSLKFNVDFRVEQTQ